VRPCTCTWHPRKIRRHAVASHRRAVCRLLHLEGGSLGEVGVRSVVYFVRANIPNAEIIAEQVQDLNR
jgi:hypothetical protein